VTDALKWIQGGGGFQIRLREYHYADRTAMQHDWFAAVKRGLPDIKVSLCVGANGSTGDAMSVAEAAADWLEGVNEPNTDFGQGTIPYQQTEDIQRIVKDGGPIDCIMGPSIVAGMPNPEGWIREFCGAGLDTLNTLMGIGNGHLYPPDDTDAPGTSMGEYIGGLWTAYAQHPIALTEYHPTLFNQHGRAPGQSDWNGDRDAFYTITGLFRAAKCTIAGLWWYALFDYGSTYICGLFRNRHADDPRPAARALKNLFAVCADTGPNRRTFAPGKLNLGVAVPVGGAFDLWQASDGRWMIPLWLSGREPGGVAQDVTVVLDKKATAAELFDPLAGGQPIADWTNEGQFTFPMNACVRVLVVVP
jgi:hypothetical protein